MDHNIIYRLLSFSITLGSMTSLFGEISSYLAPIDLISLRHCSNRLKLEISENSVHKLFATCLQEGLLPFHLKLKDFSNILERCDLFLSGSFLMHAMIRDFTGLGDIDLFALPTRAPESFQKDLIELYGYEALTSGGLDCGFDRADPNHLLYPGERFRVQNFYNHLGQPDWEISKVLSVIVMKRVEMEPNEIVQEFDIDIVQLVMLSDLKCPFADLIDYNGTNIPVVLAHLLRRKFCVPSCAYKVTGTGKQPSYPKDIKWRVNKYLKQKNFKLCNRCMSKNVSCV